MGSKKSKFLYSTLLFLFIFKIGLAQQTQIVDFLKVTAQIEPIASEGKVKGTVAYSFKVLQKTDSIYLDAIAMDISNVALEGVRVSAAKDKIWCSILLKLAENTRLFFHMKLYLNKLYTSREIKYGRKGRGNTLHIGYPA